MILEIVSCCCRIRIKICKIKIYKINKKRLFDTFILTVSVGFWVWNEVVGDEVVGTDNDNGWTPSKERKSSMIWTNTRKSVLGQPSWKHTSTLKAKTKIWMVAFDYIWL